MATQFYPSFFEALLSGDIDLTSQTVKAALLPTSTTYNAAHDFYNDVSSAVIGTPQEIGSKTVTGGVFDGADVTFTSPATGNTCNVLLYIDTSDPATSPLIGLYDNGTGVPISTDGSDVTLEWDNGTNKIFKLTNPS